MPEPSNRLLSQILQSAERAAEVGLLGAVLGYVSLRSHFSQLGFSLTAGLGLENYLRETYSFLFDLWSAFADPLAAIAGTAIGWVCIFVIGLLIWAGRSGKIPLPTGMLRHAEAAIVPMLIAGQLFLIQDLMNSAGAESQRSMAVGKLSETADRQHGRLFFTVSVWLCAAAWLAWSRWRRAEQRSAGPVEIDGGADIGGPASRIGGEPSRARRLLLPLNIVFSLFLPIIDGLTVRDSWFQIAAVKVDGSNAAECGLMVMATSSEVILWKAESGVGMAVSVPATKIQRIATGGERDLYAAIQEAARTRAPSYPGCPLTESPAK